MERELWRRIVGALKRLPRTRPRNAVYTEPQIIGVYLWSVLHDRPVNWACDRRNWPMQAWRRSLPDQSTMSRRLARVQTQTFLEMLLDRLAPAERDALVLRIDGKPLPIAKHSQDRRAAIGRGAGGFQKGYKLHAIYAQNNRPIAYRVTPMNIDERVVAQQLLQEHQLGEGYCWPMRITRPIRCMSRRRGSAACSSLRAASVTPKAWVNHASTARTAWR